MHNYKKLKVWQEAIELTIPIYAITNNFPAREQYNLISQINRSAVSIASNIAEGAGRNSPKDFKRFLSIANGSSYELETQLIISKKLGFIDDLQIEAIELRIQYIQKMIFKLQQSLNNGEGEIENDEK